MEKKITLTALAALLLSFNGSTLQADQGPCVFPGGAWKHTCGKHSKPASDVVIAFDKEALSCTLSTKCDDAEGHAKDASFMWTLEYKDQNLALTNDKAELKDASKIHQVK